MGDDNPKESRFRVKARDKFVYAIGDRDDDTLSLKNTCQDGLYLKCITDKCNGTGKLNGNGKFHCNVCAFEFSLEQGESKKEKPSERYYEKVRKKLEQQKEYADTGGKKEGKKA